MDFNRAQEKAISPEGGVTLVIAGAGTGKTRCLVEKTVRIIGQNIAKPEAILALTFSRKAAEELKERIVQRIGEAGKRIIAGTFHSFCYSLLREYYRGEHFYLTNRDFSIIDAEKQEEILFRLLRNNLEDFLGFPINLIVRLIANWNSLSRDKIMRLRSSGLYDTIERVIATYSQYKCAHNLFDFHDLMAKAIEILHNDTDFRRAIFERYSYIFVDEFQDTSDDNFLLLNLLLPPKNRNLFVVGDDWQSIYGFRNARVEYTVNMRKYFPETRIINLTVNYRSKKEIVTLSNTFIRRNRFRTKKKLFSARGRGGTVRGYTVKERIEEISLIKKILPHLKGNAAILFRNNWQGEIIQKALGKDAGMLSFLTMHGSKGLEFKTVIIAGISDDIIPDPSNDMEEERRLLYVALTRAKDECIIIAHQKNDGTLAVFARELKMRFSPFSETF